MSRVPVSLEITDLSQFARGLARQWPEQKPSHLAMMNMLAKASGFKNYQHLLATRQAAAPVELDKRSKRWLRLFDDNKRAVRWPAKFIDQRALLWGVASQMPKVSDQTEKQVNALILAHICFEDFAIVRREFVESGVLGRTEDGNKYWSKPFQVPEEFQALVAAL